MSDPTKIVIVALDHITLRWENEDIDPRIALALGVVANERAEHDILECSKATADMIMYGIGFYRVSPYETKHVPLQDFLGN